MGDRATHTNGLVSPMGEDFTIGLCASHGLTPGAWSGTTYGVATGLHSLGVSVRAIRGTGGPVLSRLVSDLPSWRVRTVANRVARAAQIRQAGLDGVLQFDSAAVFTGQVPLVMYEDMTVRQAISVGARWVVTRAAADLNAWIERQRRLYETAVAVCAMSPWTAASVVHDYGIAPEKVHVVGAGPNHVIDAPPDRDWSTPRFLFVGVDFQRKNGRAVLDAFRAVKATQPSARLDVVGEHPALDGDGVVGHGRLSISDASDRARLAELYAAATCFVLPSKLEPFGLAYLEAANAGLPCIAGSVGGSFVDDSCGRVVDPFDLDDIIRAMSELADPAVASALGGAGRERAQLYRWPLVAGRILRCYASALGRPADGLPEFL